MIQLEYEICKDGKLTLARYVHEAKNVIEGRCARKTHVFSQKRGRRKANIWGTRARDDVLVNTRHSEVFL
ncbi:unnamed protein product [Allacma fusca]|uniref:Uncharacterized protein n=1 Tax=Allacma fusca TaxID=39272 RepID=A0A8J2LN06_9HEXA|nr:unnamed protein product [Allacma fusca]